MRGNRSFSFSSVAEVLAALDKAPAHPSNDWLTNAHAGEIWGRGGICEDRGISTPREARRALANPMFPAGVERIQRLAAQINAPTPVSVRRVARRAPQGDELDMQRVWNGELDTAWREMARAARVGPARVLIAVNASISGGESAETLAWRGVAALALAEALLGAGHMVRVVSAYQGRTADSASSRFTCECVVMDCGEAFDIHKAASLLASGLLARGILYDLQTRSSIYPVNKSIGYVEPLSEETLNRVGFDTIAIADSSIHNAKSAEKWIGEQVAIIDARNGDALAA